MAYGLRTGYDVKEMNAIGEWDTKDKIRLLAMGINMARRRCALVCGIRDEDIWK